jgi:hypothetical protein
MLEACFRKNEDPVTTVVTPQTDPQPHPEGVRQFHEPSDS